MSPISVVGIFMIGIDCRPLLMRLGKVLFSRLQTLSCGMRLDISDSRMYSPTFMFKLGGLFPPKL